MGGDARCGGKRPGTAQNRSPRRATILLVTTVPPVDGGGHFVRTTGLATCMGFYRSVQAKGVPPSPPTTNAEQATLIASVAGR